MKKSFLLLCVALVATVTQAHTMDRAACHAQKKCTAQTQTVTDSILNAPHKYHEHYYERLQLFDQQPAINTRNQCKDRSMDRRTRHSVHQSVPLLHRNRYRYHARRTHLRRFAPHRSGVCDMDTTVEKVSIRCKSGIRMRPMKTR